MRDQSLQSKCQYHENSKMIIIQINSIIKIIVQTIYDIVKAHGGELKVETKVDEGNPDSFGKGKGTLFIITLPITIS